MKTLKLMDLRDEMFNDIDNTRYFSQKHKAMFIIRALSCRYLKASVSQTIEEIFQADKKYDKLKQEVIEEINLATMNDNITNDEIKEYLKEFGEQTQE